MNNVGGLEPAPRQGLAGDVSERLRAAIMAGQFVPGSPLREVDLAAQLQVSRGVIRDALTVLQGQGLVVRSWHRETRVVEVTGEAVLELYSLRAALDRLAAVTASVRATPAAITALADAAAEIATAASRGESRERLVALDIRFHDRIYDAAGNAQLSRAWEAIRSQVQLFQLRRALLDEPGYRARVVTEHLHMLEAIQGRDPELGDMAERHVHAAAQRLMGQ